MTTERAESGYSLAVRTGAEGIATGFLLIAVVGSGIMGQRLAGGNAAITLLANAFATGCTLWVLISTTGPISGAHLNPLVTLTAAFRRDLSARDAVAYVLAQFGGAIAGVNTAHVMFGMPLVSRYTQTRAGAGMFVSEGIATLGLLATIQLTASFDPRRTATAVASFITAAYWFTASTSFANPAVTIARSLTGTFTGIRLRDVPIFLFGQLAGAFLAFPLASLVRQNAGKELRVTRHERT